ncbi:MAG TPA: SufS family cysteine desulfurase [Thermoanaerobaculia bacterium]|nr:SufS family cysteine desulfurase [Thermoanaerobaculia bacterium]HUM28819.1 SufS family cysteine desulfurase [Thermoanaerobaculia bacterium]HXK69076.1 SufS family cysteine desulfurase [Thermoanaerobaculia bacterium]
MWREDFPAFRDSSLVYLDSGASTQKPFVVLDAEREFYETTYANVHRGVYPLSEAATERYEAARSTAAAFLGANPEETIFVRSTTEALNLVASSLIRHHLQPGDGVAVTVAEHHSNFVPWQQLALQNGNPFTVLSVDQNGTLPLKQVEQALVKGAKVLACTMVSNVLGSTMPIRDLARLVHEHGALLVVDGAQAIAHMEVNVRDLEVDFFAFSGHKIYGPTGIGVLYGRHDLLEDLPPFLFGGEMIAEVHVDRTTFASPPYKFEAGTPPIAQAVGLASALDYVTTIGLQEIRSHEHRLIQNAWNRLSPLPGITLYGPGPDNRTGVLAFTLEGVHPHDIAGALGHDGICIRAGHHCAQPLHDHLGIQATARISMGCYNTIEDLERLEEGLKNVRRLFLGAA